MTGSGAGFFGRRLRRLSGGRAGGFLARFLGHTPSFRRFQRVNHSAIAGPALELPALGKSADLGVWLQRILRDTRSPFLLKTLLGLDDE